MADHEATEYEDNALSTTVPKLLSVPNILIQITLLYSIKPVVSRLLSVPPLITFHELHEAIAASFNYSIMDTEDGDRVYPHFDVFEASQNRKPPGRRANVLSLICSGGYDGKEREVWDAETTEIYRVFDEQEGFRFCDKSFHYTCHGPDPIEHSLQIQGKAAEDTKGKVVCLGGQGSTALADWKEMTDVKPQRGPSTWKLDLAEVNLRLVELQKG